MPNGKEERYEKERKRLKEDADNGKITQQEYDAILEFLDAKDPERLTVSDHTGDSTKTYGTLAGYAYRLRRFAYLSEFDLTDTRTVEINRFCDELRIGSVEEVKDDGLTKGTVKTYQGTLRKFYEYFPDFDVDKDEIVLFTNTDSPVDERDIFDKEDIKALRNAAEHPRDKALVDLLLYTGQRLSAVLNLRIRDIDVEEGVFYLNEEAGDLKGATGKRPLLYAQKSCRDWLRSHPAADDPQAHFITHKHNWEDTEYTGGERLDNSTIYRQLRRIGKKAGVEKPVNAHNFRHTFVTICKRNYEMDNDTIKRLIGHRPDSTVMETTYSHLTDDDVIDSAERATGIKEEEPESPLTPDICENCGEPIPIDDAKACPSCGIIYSPNAKAAKDQMDERLYESAKQADDEQEKSLDALKEYLQENPEKVAELMESIDQ